MTFGENLQYLRKVNALTQEQLADQLEVSRQTVSKWELDVNLPEMDKIIVLCEMFHCKMDELIRGNVKAVDMNKMTDFKKASNKFIGLNLLGIGLIFIGVIVMFLCFSISNDAVAIAVISLLIFVTIGIIVITPNGMIYESEKKKYENFIPTFTEHEIEKFERLYHIFVSVGIGIILLSTTLLVAFFLLKLTESIDVFLALMCFMIPVTVAILMIVFVGMMKEKYEFNNNKSIEK